MSWKRQDYKYCGHCGTKLIDVGHYTHHFDELTGDPVQRYIVRCPAYVLYRGDHFREEFEEDDMIVHRYY